MSVHADVLGGAADKKVTVGGVERRLGGCGLWGRLSVGAGCGGVVLRVQWYHTPNQREQIP